MSYVIYRATWKEQRGAREATVTYYAFQYAQVEAHLREHKVPVSVRPEPVPVNGYPDATSLREIEDRHNQKVLG